MTQIVQFSSPHCVEVVDQPAGDLGPGQVRVRTSYSGISAGTELTAYRGTNPYLNRSWDPAQRLFVDDASGLTYPVAGFGYSEVGELVEVAPDVADDPAVPPVGAQVWGIWGHRGEAVLPAAAVRGRAVPEGLDPIAATFARVGAVALNAVLAADVHLGETVAVFGQGVLGLLATRLVRLSGGTVVAVDTVPGRLEKAQEYGAAAALDARDGTVGPQLRRLTDGRGADVAIEISGSYPALHEAIRAVAPDGRVVAAGFYQGDGAGLRLGDEFHHNRVQLICSQIGGVPPAVAGRWDQSRLNRTFLQLAVDRQIDPVGLVSHIVPVEEAAEAYRMLDRRPHEALQVVLKFS
ncbi:zinc-binding dehydrogenase [Spirilliplanes yamanashiensis]|uniref:Oxidoreductase n=1 Tax=Spirilliplanes yamanashiensis TaxID=42233 RepID=A0A8J3Y7A3_9ACTN|nr:zinc-binding dehydrogenase [Spirilliplanes yamanashiensis]MDP9817223.1 2-desacetyl-2-hydroxyethyl bacteriochlorophyllide A dehydrogenase [Spirilliplanes yamanashiensis]GIJ03123.1 oxidoreductase [Spirilliplanes yamanashiensis]